MYTDRTKELFAGLIERPPLSDQLLQRPPFRFLHDIVKVTIKNTGFLMDNFTNEEMDASNITDKTAKANFLKTLIKALNDDGSLNNVKAAKIMAGKEPEMTNLMLQKLAIDAAAFRDSILKDNANEERQKKKARKKERNNKGLERKITEKEKRHSSRSKEKRKEETESEPKTIKEIVDSNEQGDSIDEGHFEDIAPETSSVKMEPVVHTDQESPVNMKTEDGIIADNIRNENEQPLASPTLKEQLRLSTSSGRPRTSASRLGTAAARPAPPKIKKKRNVQTSGVIVGERMESDEYFVVEIEPSYDQTDQTNADELANLQKTMQQITQTTHLLARFLDNAQEDAESMLKEMEEWCLESTKNTRELGERKANAEGSLENLLLRLNQLDEQIKEVKSAIVQTKAKVIANEEKIRIIVNNI
ncbi:hypothetical protein WUBG_01940 [Wuchereria bancrofti]|uniref:TRAF3-interacting protein 1 n=1 Tax=Wuchereria bancrofti TaxID=6293 RepID=J9EX20_WUCBA|nr:hypothetical protein WUBG_01940 [Wuchereria bancrofti]